MHSAKGGVGWGRGQKGDGRSFASLFYGFCVHGVTPLLAGKGSESEKPSRKVRKVRYTGPCEPRPSTSGVGGWGAPLLPTSVAQDLHPSCAVLVSLVQHEAPEGPSTLPHCSFLWRKSSHPLLNSEPLQAQETMPHSC